MAQPATAPRRGGRRGHSRSPPIARIPRIETRARACDSTSGNMGGDLPAVRHACGWRDRLRLDLGVTDFRGMRGFARGEITGYATARRGVTLIDVKEWRARDIQRGAGMRPALERAARARGHAAAEIWNYQVLRISPNAVANAVPGTKVSINPSDAAPPTSALPGRFLALPCARAAERPAGHAGLDARWSQG